MVDVFYDNEMLSVRLNKNIYKKMLKVAKEAAYFEYLHKIGVMLLPPTKRMAKILFNMGLCFDDSAKIFLVKLKKVEKNNGMDFSELLPLELRKYQQQGVMWMLKYKIHFILGDEMGLGKSVQIATYLFYKQKFPILIVCPASLKLNWEREIKIWTGKKCLVLEGLSPYPIEGLLNEFPVVIINYDILGRRDKQEVENEDKRIKKARKIKELKKIYKKAGAYDKLNKLQNVDCNTNRKKIIPKGWIDTLKQIQFNDIIFDECQFIGEYDNPSARTQSIIDLCRELKNARRIFLSGTPYQNMTRQFFTVLHLADGRTFNNIWRYKMKFCDPVKTRFGWEFNGLSNGDQLHELVSRIMLRRLKADVLDELPAKIKSIVPMKPNSKLLQKYYNDEMVMLGGKIINEKQTYQDLKRMTYYIKRDSCIQWIKDYLEVNNKLVVIVYHVESFDFFMKKFEGIAVGINGSVPSNKRQGIVDKFQMDKKIKLAILQIRSGGVGITLTVASAIAFVELGDIASEHEQAEDRIHRISQKADKIIAYYLIIENTVDEDIIENIRIGYANQKQVLDGEVNAEFINDSPEEFARGVLSARKNKIYNNV
jgi:SWI/SNF-related matrix-associated actin-dependent regulator 1 of chromatin subfamily A